MISKPWVEKNRVTAAMNNQHVGIGQRDGMRGLYAMRAFAPGDPVAAFRGRIVSREQLFALRTTDPTLFDRINEYGVLHATSDGHLYTENLDAPGAHLINHSCGPNAKWGEVVRDGVLVRAVKSIAVGEEITAHYGWLGIKAAMENTRHKCLCRAAYCAGTIELNIEFIREGDEGGPRLSVEEIGNRLLADIVNDTDAHSIQLMRYSTDALSMFDPTAGIEAARVDPIAYFTKLRHGAHIAIPAALRMREAGASISESRLHQIADIYKVPFDLTAPDEHHPLRTEP